MSYDIYSLEYIRDESMSTFIWKIDDIYQWKKFNKII